MAIKYAIESHAVGFPSKVLAAEGGKHVYNIQLTNACDNGNFLAKGDYISLNLYAEAAASSFSGVVREKAANGNYYVEVVDPGDALFMCNVPAIEEDWTNSFKKESNFYNEAGDVVRGYELAVGDVVEISEAGFTAAPTIGATVSLSGKKLA